jgi:hypothetical protein
MQHPPGIPDHLTHRAKKLPVTPITPSAHRVGVPGPRRAGCAWIVQAERPERRDRLSGSAPSARSAIIARAVLGRAMPGVRPSAHHNSNSNHSQNGYSFFVTSKPAPRDGEAVCPTAPLELGSSLHSGSFARCTCSPASPIMVFARCVRPSKQTAISARFDTHEICLVGQAEARERASFSDVLRTQVATCLRTGTPGARILPLPRKPESVLWSMSSSVRTQAVVTEGWGMTEHGTTSVSGTKAAQPKCEIGESQTLRRGSLRYLSPYRDLHPQWMCLGYAVPTCSHRWSGFKTMVAMFALQASKHPLTMFWDGAGTSHEGSTSLRKSRLQPVSLGRVRPPGNARKERAATAARMRSAPSR